MVSIPSIFLFIGALFNFGSFIWAAFTFFEFRDPPTPQVKVLSALTLASQFAILVATLIGQVKWDTYFFVGASIILLSAYLFWWCIRINAEKKLTAAYDSNSPEHLMKQGPYAVIRHPFYTSYMLTYIGGFIGAKVLWAIIPVAIPMMVYFHASKFEEEKFNDSALSKDYLAYKKVAGRFWPKLIRRS